MPSSRNKIIVNTDLVLSPNPTMKNVKIDIDFYDNFKKGTVYIYSNTDQIMKAIDLDDSSTKKQSFIVDVSDFLSGIYTVKTVVDVHTLKSQPLIVK